MLSLSSKKYYVPIRQEAEDGSGDVHWKIQSRIGRDVLLAFEFRYVIPMFDADGTECDRISFIYNNRSVRPDGRTLRRYGPERFDDPNFINNLVSQLSSNVEEERYFYLYFGQKTIKV